MSNIDVNNLDAITAFSYEENEKRKIQYIDKIISVISPILMGLNHWQISLLLNEVTKKILETTVFTASTGKRNQSPDDPKSG